MANDVNTYISVHRFGDNPSAVHSLLQSWNDLLAADNPKLNLENDFQHLVSKSDQSNELYNANITPAKWCYVEEIDPKNHVQLISGWTYPKQAVDWIAQQIHAVSANSYLFVQYEDEMPNFAGAVIYKNGEIQEDYSFHWEEEELEAEINDTDDAENEWDAISILQHQAFKQFEEYDSAE